MKYNTGNFSYFWQRSKKVSTMENNIKLLLIRFKNELRHDEIKYFRGAVIHGLPYKDILFHNHKSEGLRYAYPLIQYKRIQNRAAILCLNEGTEVIGDFFSSYQPEFLIGNHPVTLQINCLNPVFFSIAQTETDTVTYQLTRWLPLNTQNYQLYHKLAGMAERILFLEKILVANILSCTKGLKIHLDQQLVCKIQEITDSYPVVHKGVKFMAFNIVFSANITLPDYIGIGKNASMDCGILQQLDI